MDPVLFLNANRDMPVSPKLDDTVIDRSPKTRYAENHEFVVVSGAIQNLKRFKIEIEFGLFSPVDESAVKEIGTRCRQKLSAATADGRSR